MRIGKKMSPDRLKKAYDSVKKEKLTGFIASKLPNVRYLSGYSGSNGLLLLVPPRAYLFTDFRYAVQARKEVKKCQVIIAERDLLGELAKIKALQKKVKIGYESAHLTVQLLEKIKELIPKVSLVGTENIVESIAIIKDTAEINKLKKAAKIADMAFDEILKLIKPGVKERDLALELHYKMVKAGAEGPSFNFIVASGQRSSMPHGVASDRKFKKGDFITLDFGCFYEGYPSDLTRTVVLGKASLKQKRIYDIVLKAQTMSVEAARPGMPARELDKVARDIIIREGYGDNFGHGLGHGLGLDAVHSNPVVSPRSQDTLEPGNVITIEPGIYIPNWGGVRIEDDVVITSSGHKVLTKSPKSLIEL
jgi:Xaa-Pro aminopeptidase